jgi:hypothetical protein
LTYEDNTTSIFPIILGHTNLIDRFEQNNDHEYQVFIDNDNEEMAVLVNNVVLAIESFSHLKNIKIGNQEHFRITEFNRGGGEDASGSSFIKISDLVITQTDVLGGNTDNLFSLKACLIKDSLVVYNPTDTRDVMGDGRGVGYILKDQITVIFFLIFFFFFF